MAWTLPTTWLRPPFRRAVPPNGQVLARALRETAQQWGPRLAAAAAGRSPAAQLAPALQHLDHDLSRKPRVAILGEFNAGKTTLTNLLARTRALDTDVLANTRLPTLVHDGAQDAEPILVPERSRDGTATNPLGVTMRVPFEYELSASPADLLKACSIIDTPGLADPTHADRVGDVFARIADIAIWCSVAGQCWRESERQAWDSFPGRLRRYGVLVLTGADSVPRAADRQRILARLQREAVGRFGVILFLSGRDAAAAIDDATGQITNPGLWEESGAAEIERVVARLVRHVSDQRALRSRRWAERLLRQMADFPHATLGPAWWVAPLMRWSAEARRTSVAVRGHRLSRDASATLLADALTKLRYEIAGKLDRIGRAEDAALVEALINWTLDAVEECRQANSTIAADTIGELGARLFNEISQLMRGTERETAAVAELQTRLLNMVGAKKGRKSLTLR
jgi:hypothetical protein